MYDEKILPKEEGVIDTAPRLAISDLAIVTNKGRKFETKSFGDDAFGDFGTAPAPAAESAPAAASDDAFGDFGSASAAAPALAPEPEVPAVLVAAGGGDDDCRDDG